MPFFTPLVVPRDPLPPNWVVPAGSHTGDNFQLNWTEIIPDATPRVPTDPDAYPG